MLSKFKSYILIFVTFVYIFFWGGSVIIDESKLKRSAEKFQKQKTPDAAVHGYGGFQRYSHGGCIHGSNPSDNNHLYQ